jgi:hypothetical protein
MGIARASSAKAWYIQALIIIIQLGSHLTLILLRHLTSEVLVQINMANVAVGLLVILGHIVSCFFVCQSPRSVPLYEVDRSQPAQKSNTSKAENKDEFLNVELLLSLDKTRVQPDDKVRLTEMIPASLDCAVKIISHDVYLIAEYNKQKKIFINLEPKSYLWRDTKEDFKDLPLSLIGFGLNGWPLTVSNPRQKGREIEFSAYHLGVFQITAKWLIRQSNDARGYIHSIPIILVVQPPVNDQGEVIVKPEWLIQ